LLKSKIILVGITLRSHNKAIVLLLGNNTIELLGISIYITNITEEVLSSKQVHEFYSLRW